MATLTQDFTRKVAIVTGGASGIGEAVARAIAARGGHLGRWLRLTQAHPSHEALNEAGVNAADWWNSQLHAYHWAIQVGRNV